MRRLGRSAHARVAARGACDPRGGARRAAGARSAAGRPEPVRAARCGRSRPTCGATSRQEAATAVSGRRRRSSSGSGSPMRSESLPRAGARRGAGTGRSSAASSIASTSIPTASGRAIVRDYKSGSVAARAGRRAMGRTTASCRSLCTCSRSASCSALEPVAGLYQPLGGDDLRPRGVFLEGAPVGRTPSWPTTPARADELDEVLADAAARAVALAAQLRSGELKPCPETCSRDGCRYPGICRHRSDRGVHRRADGRDRAPRRGSAARRGRGQRQDVGAGRALRPRRARGRRRRRRDPDDHVHREGRGGAARPDPAPAARARRRRAARATEGAFISTIHGFCARVLRAHALAAGIDPAFVVLDEPEARAARRQPRSTMRSRSSPRTSPVAVELIAAYGPGAPARRDPRTCTASCARAADASPSSRRCRRRRTSRRRVRALWRAAAEALDRARAIAAAPASGRAGARAARRLRRVIAAADSWPGEIDAAEAARRERRGAVDAALCGAYTEALARFRGAGEARRAVGAHATARPAAARVRRALRAAQARALGARLRGSRADAPRAAARQTASCASATDERFVHVMVDELQDTNRVQLELIEPISRGNLFTVGDAQQSIYGFRHADVELFEARGAERSTARARVRRCRRTSARGRRSSTALNGAFAGALGERVQAARPGRADADRRRAAGRAAGRRQGRRLGRRRARVAVAGRRGAGARRARGRADGGRRARRGRSCC